MPPMIKISFRRSAWTHLGFAQGPDGHDVLTGYTGFLGLDGREGFLQRGGTGKAAGREITRGGHETSLAFDLLCHGPDRVQLFPARGRPAVRGSGRILDQ